MNTGLVLTEQSIPELNWGMPVEVMRDFDTMLMFGKLAAVKPDGLTIRRVSSELCFPTLPVDSTLLIRCYDIQMTPVLLRAKVTNSSGMECTLGEMEWIHYQTQRKNVRYPLCPPAVITVLGGAAPGQSRLCQLLNISVGGACMVAETVYDMGQTLRLQVRLTKTGECMPYLCKVVRIMPRSGNCFEYGLLFEHLSKEQLRYLAQKLRDRFRDRG